MEQSRLEYLFTRYVQFQCTQNEEKEFMEMISQTANRDELFRLIDGMNDYSSDNIRMPDELAELVLRKIFESGEAEAIIIPMKGKKKGFRAAMLAAAAVLLFAMTSLWYFGKTQETNHVADTSKTVNKTLPILPGGNKALLTMADGTAIELDSLLNGTLVQGNIKIKKQGGLLEFDASGAIGAGDLQYNTLTTPKGGRYQIVLPDGSRVWLNAASSLQFPAAFAGDERLVKLTGEAYFEVARNEEKPFDVMAGDVTVKVLGTQFNVNAYEDENMVMTSLLEGSVKVVNGNRTELLEPGKQATVKKNEESITISNVDMDEVMAWKNGLFQFDGANIKSIMREIGRWYNVDIEYSGNPGSQIFQGKISRDAQLSDVLKILELSDVKFRVEGRKIIVL